MATGSHQAQNNIANIPRMRVPGGLTRRPSSASDKFQAEQETSSIGTVMQRKFPTHSPGRLQRNGKSQSDTFELITMQAWKRLEPRRDMHGTRRAAGVLREQCEVPLVLDVTVVIAAWAVRPHAWKTAVGLLDGEVVGILSAGAGGDVVVRQGRGRVMSTRTIW